MEGKKKEVKGRDGIVVVVGKVIGGEQCGEMCRNSRQQGRRGKQDGKDGGRQTHKEKERQSLPPSPVPELQLIVLSKMWNTLKSNDSSLSERIPGLFEVPLSYLGRRSPPHRTNIAQGEKKTSTRIVASRHSATVYRKSFSACG